MKQLNSDDLAMLRQRLEEERALLESKQSLGGVASPNPSVPGDWLPKSKGDYGNDDEAVKSRDYGRNAAITQTLEARYRNILHALERMEQGTYGTCEVSGEPIERERLLANPAARTNIANKEKDSATEKEV